MLRSMNWLVLFTCLIVDRLNGQQLFATKNLECWGPGHCNLHELPRIPPPPPVLNNNNNDKFTEWEHSLDQTKDPCQDFYAFTCGRYEEEHKILFEYMFQMNAAVTAARPIMEKCLENAVFDDTPTNSSAVTKMRHLLYFYAPFKNAPYAPAYKKWVAQRMTFYFPIIVDHIFMHSCFPADILQQIQHMIDEIQLTVGMMIYEKDWLDEKTKNALLKKLAKMREFVGVSNQTYLEQKLDELYEKLDINEKDALFVMERKIHEFNWEVYNEGVDGLDGFDVLEINAYNSILENAIFIMAGIMNSQNYNPNNAAALNYGRIGSIMAHEMWHSFDSTGIFYDENGEERNMWTSRSLKRFVTRAICLIEQYNDQVDAKTGLHVNGSVTLGENIADNGGIRAAFKTYMNHLDEHNLLDVPGFSQYSNEQSFFIAYGTLWCFTGSTEAHKLILTNDVHSPFNFRVNVPLMNMPEFSEAFNCPVGSPMNPEQKCQLW